MREHEKEKGAAQAPAQQQDEQIQVNDPRVIEACRRARGQLLRKADQIKPTVSDGLLIFQGMARADEKAETEVDHSFVHRMHGSLVETITDKLLESGGVLLELGEHMAAHATLVFGKAKSAIDSQIEKEDKLTALQAVDIVVSQMYEAASALSSKAREVIIGLEQRALWGAYKKLRNVAMIDTDEDRELEEGLKDRELENILGVKTGGAISHDLAKQAYHVYRVEIMVAKPVHEQLGDQKEILGGGFEEQKEKKARDAEGNIGSMSNNVEQDVARRGRTQEFMESGAK